MMNSTSRRLLLASVAVSAFAAASPTLAQDNTADLGEVVITGTRIAGFDAPTPVTTLGGADLQANAARNVADLVADIPELRQRRNIGQTLVPVGLAQIDLRGLNGTNSAQRTLVMLDGRRMAPTASNGWVDANVIPTNIISRVEVVTGGASAAYGSDAVAGVVNFILDRTYEGFKADISYGQSKYSDNRQPGISAAYGTSFAGGKGHIVASAEYFSDSGALSQNQRPWGREGWAANVVTKNGRAFTSFRANSKFSNLTLGGVTATTAPAVLQGIQFGPGGTVLPFVRGTEVGTQFMTGGDGFILDTQTIATKTKRESGFVSFTYDLSDNLQIFADALYSSVDIFANSAPHNDGANQTGTIIRVDNAFLPASVKALMTANNIASFPLGRVYLEEGFAYSPIGTDHGRVTFGAKGDLSDKWNWEAFAALARTKYRNDSYVARNVQRFSQGIDSVISPTTGQAICRANLVTITAPGCVPINPFGAGSVTPQAIAWFEGVATDRAHLEEDVVGITLRGKPFTLPAGDVGFAGGVEARRDETRRVGDPTSQTNGWKTNNFVSFSGEVKVKEAFAEVAIPLLADMPLVKKLDVNFAGRITDYSTSGTVKTWKAGANYEPTGWLRFRGTVSRDIRAPTIFELYTPVSNTLIVTVTDPVKAASQQVFQLAGGNSGLVPEVAKTYTVGGVFSPAFLPGFRASVDYYKITIKDVIATLTSQQTIDQCYKAGNTEYCGLITRGADNSITSIVGTNINAALLRTAGVDTELQYRFSLPGDAGELTLRTLAAYTQYRITRVAGIDTDIAGQNNGGIPTWRINTSATYNKGPLMLRGSARFMSSGKFNKQLVEGLDIEDNHMKGFTYIDVAASYQVNDRVQVYANVNNLFNVAPVLSPSAIVEVGYSGGGNYDLIGRFATVGVRLTF